METLVLTQHAKHERRALYLAGISLAVSMANVTGVSLMIGLSSALDTLCAQAFGAQKFHLLGEHLQRAILILSIPAFATSMLWFFMRPVLIALGQDPEIAGSPRRFAERCGATAR